MKNISPMEVRSIGRALTQVTGVDYTLLRGTTAPDLGGGQATLSHAIYQHNITLSDVDAIMNSIESSCDLHREMMRTAFRRCVERYEKQSVQPVVLDIA